MRGDAKRLRFGLSSTTRHVCAHGYATRLIKRRRTRAATQKAFWDAWAGKLKIDLTETRLVRKESHKNDLGEQVIFQQRIAGRRISKAWFRLDFNHDGDIVGFSNRCITKRRRKSPPTTDATVHAKEAVKLAKVAMQGEGRNNPGRRRAIDLLEDPTLVLYRLGNRVLRSWRIACSSKSDKAVVYLDAATGSMINKESLVSFSPKSGNVFDPNPMTALNLPSLKVDAAIPLSAYRQVSLQGLDNSGFLDGEYVSTAMTASRIKRTGGDFSDVTRTDAGFAEVMAYFHIDKMQRYIRSLVLSDRFPDKVLVDARTQTFSQSAYDFQSGILHLFNSIPRDGEDAEVIVHEYAHAVHGAVSPGWGQSGGYAKPMSEGFADYLAASCLNDQKPDVFKSGIASWHARYEGESGAPPFLRRLDCADPFAQNSPRLIEIWSACLWDIRAKLGQHRADTTFLLALHLFDPHQNKIDTFYDGALAIRRVNDQIYSGVDLKDIDAVFRLHGIFQ